MTGLIVDSFAGAGGASIGIERALGRPVDVAINHDPVAIGVHKANHPATEHLTTNIWRADPDDVVRRHGHRVALLWASPDCKHFSKAKGARPVKRNIRDLAWVVVLWAKRARPAMIAVENVEEFEGWGPVSLDGVPCRDRKGETFRRWIRELRRLGYRVEWRQIRACDHGAPTIRRRLFIVARCDGLPIVWPDRTHGPPDDPDVVAGRLQPWCPTADIIDWSLPCPSIFLSRAEGRAAGVNRPLADATMARIARGVRRYVIDAAQPFLVPVTHQGDRRVYGLDEPARTVTSANRGEQALVAPFVSRTDMHKSNAGCVYGAGEPVRTVTSCGGFAAVAPYLVKNMENNVARSVHDPLSTILTGRHHFLAAAFLAQHNTGVTGHAADRPLSTITQRGTNQAVVAAHLQRDFGASTGQPCDTPAGTVTAGGGGKTALVTSHMLKLRGTCRDGQDIRTPAPTVTASGKHVAEVRAFLIKYFGTATGQDVRDPLHTATDRARFGLVTVDGEPWQIADIGMRMLTPAELAGAQGFPPDYILDRLADGTPVTKTDQTRLVGNSVCPDVAEAIVRANLPAAMAAAAE